jgi:hypothetical protein
MACPNCDRIAKQSLKEKDELFKVLRALDEAVKLLELIKHPDAVWNEEDEAKLAGFRKVVEGKA